MMRLEHLNLVVRDIPTTLEFYQAIFPHWQIRGGGKSSWHGVERNWVHFGDDYQYLTFNDDGNEDNRDLSGHQVGLAHFAYVTDDLDGVIERLKASGYPVDKAGAEEPYRRNVYFIDPDGYEVEFVEYLTDIPTMRNRYE
ncbi:Glyoxalase/bleomycin resistance protein/dioxygenase [Shewanella halifaxensis HAW-EB4]|uniref:Glyoxalase/bleomycin resistance protein/dioxygenase n=1 Tax=Shewanella halifaxensis (strain HAW-EB4) TaxID=458817 RepID=B0TV75_SHEHH|nr:VOC family protein [Shewanella halifaxensis]ABZ75513.1 Glyoxalase/bleomycin resistance protein/dioxygenase [Shewanella halifaxensis HAW-EB4]